MACIEPDWWNSKTFLWFRKFFLYREKIKQISKVRALVSSPKDRMKSIEKSKCSSLGHNVRFKEHESENLPNNRFLSSEIYNPWDDFKEMDDESQMNVPRLAITPKISDACVTQYDYDFNLEPDLIYSYPRKYTFEDLDRGNYIIITSWYVYFIQKYLNLTPPRFSATAIYATKFKLPKCDTKVSHYCIYKFHDTG